MKRIKGTIDWKDTYEAIQAFRKDHLAPVDTMGCTSLAETLDPKIFRYQTLVSLQLSSQTKDTVNAEAMKNLKALPNGLNVPSILAISDSELNQCIQKVGFHKRKTIYLKQTAKILHDEYQDDIPNHLDGLMALPGVGPKMAYLCMQAAWGQTLGIGVDTHVHRIANRLGWVKTKDPESTRTALEDWLPKEYWADINPLLVGFGQTHCLPINPHCSTCPVSTSCPKINVKKR